MIGVITNTGFEMFNRYRPHFETEAPEIRVVTPEMVERPEDVSFVFTFRPSPDAFAPYPNLRAIFSAGAGTDAIMACPSRPEGVPVFRVEDDDQALQMAGYAAFHVHWHHRHMAQYLQQQRARDWGRELSGLSPSHKHVGILGFGHMGRAIAKGLMALGYPVSGYSRSLPQPPEPGVTHYTEGQLDAFLAQSDMLVNVLPLTDETRGLIDAEFLRKLPQGAALIHMGRGGQVDQTALVAALDAGRLCGATLDVFETEPLPADDPIWSHPKVVITPHVASIPEAVFVVRGIRDRLRALPDG
ncbi:glyoxylate/hydroxypyruvate reductase A [Salipiger sp. P9]|uniref:2-hydroxyacid dehydrogenase n=1 Tax=Salipiger pentaromativorans TaxID=2943193 RepID=UPI002157B6C9|nr:glyoxylate/hydroxypyruvate reductase A [Salipiger pentaromativorans]MCR8546359.1 glyoxylate/hydroxypyruvate reductase A [Salipiger pentaromativorans]